MKRSALFIFLLIIMGASKVHGQSPCTGTPSPNSVLPGFNFTICAGTSTNLSLANTYSSSGITFQWQSSSTSTVGPWANIFGARASLYTTPVLYSTSYFNVVITCTNSGQSITLPVTVSVVPCYTPCNGTPSNNLVPASQTICSGSSATLHMANSTAYITGYQFQWQSSLSSTGPFTSISGATTSALVSPTLNATTYFQAVITCTNGGGTYTTAPVAVLVTSCTACVSAPGSNTITGPSTVCIGSTATLVLASTYSNTGIIYQWQTSNVSPVGPFSSQPGGSPTYTTGPILANQYYMVVITCTNSSGSISLYHTINAVSCATPCSGQPGASTIAAVSQTICAGDVATLSLANSYSSTTGLSFQWRSSGSSAGPFTAIGSATATTYTSSALSSNMYYSAVITCTGSGMSYTTPVLPITVVSCTACSGTPGSNTIVPQSASVCAGSSATLTLASSYTIPGITYQWQNSTTSQAGPFVSVPNATSSTYVTPPLSTTMYYNVVITCTNTGANISITNAVYVVNCPTACAGTPSATAVVPAEQTVCIGAQAGMSLSTTYTISGITYQWYSGSSASGPFSLLPGATQPAYSHLVTGGILYFKVVVTCTNGGLTYEAIHTLTAVACNTNTTSLQGEPAAGDFKVFPNPATEQVEVESPYASGVAMSILDLTGRVVQRTALFARKSVVDIAELPRGIYLVELMRGDKVWRGKLVKE